MRTITAAAAVIALISALVGVGTAADFLIRHVCAAAREAPLEE